jgi:hypothetical protein
MDVDYTVPCKYLRGFRHVRLAVSRAMGSAVDCGWKRPCRCPVSCAPATVSTPSPRTTAHTPLTAVSLSVSSARPRYQAQLRQNLLPDLSQRQ